MLMVILRGVQHQRLNLGSLGNGALHHPLPLSPNWLLGGPDKFGGQPASTWPLGPTNTVPYANQVNQAIVPKGWHNGNWICTCGFHNYTSRAECKKCNAFMPPGDYNTSSLTPFLMLFVSKILQGQSIIQ
ncbi:putative Zinc finger, RanBP2-type superfamily [Helianthus anomalus]